jgi:hypothetical protein
MMRGGFKVNNNIKRRNNISKIHTLNKISTPNKSSFTCLLNKTLDPTTTTWDQSSEPPWTQRAWTCRILSTPPLLQAPITSENLLRSHMLTKTVMISMSGQFRMIQMSKGYPLEDRSYTRLSISSRCSSSQRGSRS